MTRPSSLGLSNAYASGYSFERRDLCVDDRRPGISAFMRIRNGAEFLATTIHSHIEYFDEIVAVHNQCTDATPEILARLQNQYGCERLRVIHYADQVFPPGSEGHQATEPNSPHSLVNYYNFALAATRYQFATKLDDDHLAIADTTKAITDAIRDGDADPDVMHCFSGLNLFRRPDGEWGILAADPISGNGDIGFFRVTPDTYFTHDRRFERFRRGGLRRSFAGFLYWHLKYVKADMGFGNYDLEINPTSRYAKRKAALDKELPAMLDLSELATTRQPNWINRVGQAVSNKREYTNLRDASIAETFNDATVQAAIERTVSSQFFHDGQIAHQAASMQRECA